NRWKNDFENAPSKEAMGRVYRDKELNENLQPLVRYLREQVGRPWNNVYSDIAARISCTNVVQKHVLDHLRDFVALHARIEGKTGLASPWYGGPYEPLTSRGKRSKFYVCPRSGILKLAPPVKRKKR